jgi:hypothetical protein
MARFQLTQPFPYSQFVAEAGTILDTDLPQWAGVVPPLQGVICLDQASYDLLCATYGPTNDQFLHLIITGPGVVRRQPS